MNLKSYSRGIGAGLIVAALVLGVGNKTEKMTDSQIIFRAKELGLIEAQTLTQISTEISEEVSTEVSVSKEEVVSISEPEPEFKEKDEITVDPIISDSTEISEEIQEETSSETTTEISTETSLDNEPEIEVEGDSVELIINKGDSSVKVARHCYEEGLVESAPEFDKYLCENNYDRKISVGTYNIPKGSDFETIAKIITRQ